MTDWVKEVCAAVRAVKPEMQIYARIFDTEERNLEVSLDAAQWIADGSIDGIILCGFDQIFYDYPVAEWRESIESKNTEGHPYKLVLGGSHYVNTVDREATMSNTIVMDEAATRGFAGMAYSLGVDGIYFYNKWFYPDLWRYEIDENGTQTRVNGTSDMLRAAYSNLENQKVAEAGARTYIVTGNLVILPLSLQENESLEVSLNTGTAPSTGTYMVTVAILGDEGYEYDNFKVTVNGVEATQIEDVYTTEGYKYKETLTWTNIYAHHKSELGQRVMQFVLDDLSVVQNLVNDIKIQNDSAYKQTISWVQVDVIP
jgi:hypothetical protein